MRLADITIMASLAVIALIETGCSKTDADAQPGGDDQLPPPVFTPVTYPKGTAQGNAAQKSIGPAGGILTSPDGALTITIPAGAVPATTLFSVQSVSNTAPVSKGPSFRLLPAGYQFATPITLTIKYNEAMLEGVDEDALDLVTQDNAGTWRTLNKTTRNRNAKTLSVAVKHLGDFSTTSYVSLKSSKTVLNPGETAILSVEEVPVADTSNVEDESPIGGAGTYHNPGHYEGTEVTGPGTIVVNPDGTITYTAPSTVDQTRLSEILATLKNLRWPSRYYNKLMKLRLKMTTQRADFFAGTYDGQAFNCAGANASVAAGVTYIQGATTEGKTVLILVNGTGVGDYPYGDASIAGNAEIRTNLKGDDVYETNWNECGPPSVLHYSTGNLSIKSYDVGGNVAGDFNVTVYEDAGCTIKSRNLSGSFRIKKQ